MPFTKSGEQHVFPEAKRPPQAPFPQQTIGLGFHLRRALRQTRDRVWRGASARPNAKPRPLRTFEETLKRYPGKSLMVSGLHFAVFGDRFFP